MTSAVAEERQSPKKRAIRLKEWGVQVDNTKAPNDEYIRNSDDSLSPGPFTLRTDSNGYILTGNSITKPGARRKLVTLGGSFVEGLFVDEKERFQSVAERLLDSSGEFLQIWNAGYSGSTALHVFNLLINKVMRAKAYIDCVLIFTSMSDSASTRRRQSYWTPDIRYAPILDPRNRNGWPDERMATFEDTEAMFSSMIATCNAFGVPVKIVLSPHRRSHWANDKYLSIAFKSQDQYVRQQSIWAGINSAAERAAIGLGADVLEGDRALPNDNHQFFYDTLHLNAAGHQLFGDWLASEVKSPGSTRNWESNA